MKRMILEKNLPYLPNKLILDIFKYFKEKYLTISYKYSLATQENYNKKNNLPLNSFKDKIKNDFKKLGLKNLENSEYKDIEFDTKDFPLSYQKRLNTRSLPESPLKIRVKIYRGSDRKYAGFIDDVDDILGIRNNKITRIFYKNNVSSRKSALKVESPIKDHKFMGMTTEPNVMTVSMLSYDSSENEYFKYILGTLRHELIHHIEKLLDKPHNFTIPLYSHNNSKSKTNYDIKNPVNYYDSNIEFKSQIMSVYSGLSTIFSGRKMTYEDLLKVFDNQFFIMGSIILTPLYIVANDEKRTLLRLKTLLNTLYRFNKLKFDKKLEKKYLKLYLSSLKRRFKLYAKNRKKDAEYAKRIAKR